MGFRISQPSFQSLYVESQARGNKIGTGTAFVVAAEVGDSFLLTNRHIVTGRHQDTGELLSKVTGAEPDSLLVWHNASTELGHFVSVDVPLYDGEMPLWIEHPTLGPKADFVALRLPVRSDIKTYPYRAKYLSHMEIEPAQTVSVVGFPFGERTGRSFAVWATGFVASEPEIDHGGRPVFLVDCRSRPGQSGSPVILHRGYRNEVAESKESEIMSELLGIYSGRINEDSDLGIVWKTYAIIDLLMHANALCRK
jgi:hypothetical protein